MLGTSLQLLGLVLICVGGFLMSIPAGLIAVGCAVAYFGLAAERDGV